MAVKDLSVKGQRKFWLNRYIPAACYVISALSILMFFLKANNSWIKILFFHCEHRKRKTTRNEKNAHLSSFEIKNDDLHFWVS